jgi:hypothetical protein
MQETGRLVVGQFEVWANEVTYNPVFTADGGFQPAKGDDYL